MNDLHVNEHGTSHFYQTDDLVFEIKQNFADASAASYDENEALG